MDEALDDLESWIREVRKKYYQDLASIHGLTVKEIQDIHERTLEKLSRIEPRNQMFIEIVLPKAIEDYKNSKI